MRVLIVSHNVLGQATNMGKTVSAYFDGWNVDDIAQIYVHSGVPTDKICDNYYRITDKEAIKSIVTRRCGTVYKDIFKNGALAEEKPNSQITDSLYQKARARTPLIYLSRNLWWGLSAWKSKKLLNWVDEFSPDAVFFASGDYAFTYKIALDIAKYKKIPLVVSCMDDYYFHNKNEGRFLGKAVYKSYMKQVRKTMEYASCLFTICDKMTVEYTKLFGKPCYTLHTPTAIEEPMMGECQKAISYVGNLGYKRHEQLIALGRAIKNVDSKDNPKFIDVYSKEIREWVLKDLNEENGIRFHGGISADQVLEVMKNSLALIHTESFDESTRKSVAYSVSTKIADSLASGVCILAYGPSEVASIEYLRENIAAYCIDENDNLESALVKFFENTALRDEITKNAIELSKKNHSPSKNCKLIADVLGSVCKNN